MKGEIVTRKDCEEWALDIYEAVEFSGCGHNAVARLLEKYGIKVEEWEDE